MSNSLSIILPIYNAESKLAAIVHRLIEVTADLTGSLELMIVDNGSTDNTEEVAMELCKSMPQINSIRTSKILPHAEAVRVGINATSGQIVLIQNVDSPVSAQAVRQLWDMRNDEELVFARSEPAHQAKARPVMHSRPTWSGGTQMIRREAVTELHEARQIAKPGMNINRVTRTDISENPSAPAMFQQISNVAMQQADR